MATPILHPEFEKLKGDIVALRQEVALGIEQLDHLRTIKPVLLARYRREIGDLELQALEERCRAEWLRRYVESVRSHIAQQQPVDVKAIEQRLNAEMAGYWRKVQALAEENARAQELLSHLLSPDEVRALRTLFRTIVKRLHPDVNPSAGAREALLLKRAQEAYGSGDLDELKAIAVALDAGTESAPPQATASLEQERDRLLGVIADLRGKIDALEARSPYNLRDKLADPGWVAAERAALEDSIEAWRRKAAVYEDQLQQVLGKGYHHVRFGKN